MWKASRKISFRDVPLSIGSVSCSWSIHSLIMDNIMQLINEEELSLPVPVAMAGSQDFVHPVNGLGRSKF